MAAGVYGAYRLWERWQSLETALLTSLLETQVGESGREGRDRSEHRLRKHFELTQQECEAVLERHLTQLRHQLNTQLNMPHLRRQMRVEGTELRNEAAWCELKVMAMTRAVCTVYVLALVTLRLRVHLNIVARHYVAEVSSTASPVSTESLNDHACAAVPLSMPAKLHFLSVESLCQSGFAPFIAKTKLAVQKHVAAIPLDRMLDVSEVMLLISSVRDEVESGPYGHVPVVHAFLSEELREIIGVDGQHEALLDEARQLCSTESFHTALCDCLDAGFTQLEARVRSFFSSPATNVDHRDKPAPTDIASDLTCMDSRMRSEMDHREDATPRIALALLVAKLGQIPAWAMPETLDADGSQTAVNKEDLKRAMLSRSFTNIASLSSFSWDIFSRGR
eukprot:scaffold197574_cov32-Tisochrysis_lutea.AAC.1